MTKFKNLGTVARALSKIDKSSPVKKTTQDPDGQRWKKLKVPVKAVVLLKLSANKNETAKSGKISKGKNVKPNPTFKKDAWKKSATATKTEIRKSSVSKSPSVVKTRDNKNLELKNNNNEAASIKKSPRKGILKTETGEKIRKKSVTINPRERKSNIYGRSSRTKTKLNKNNKDDLHDKPLSSLETEDCPAEAGSEADISERRQAARLHWRKVRLMLHYLKFPTPGIINLTDKNSKEKFSFTANLKAIQMVKKFKKIKHKQKNSVPKSGGKRKAGSFDYLGSV